MSVYQNIQSSILKGKNLLAILIDPDKVLLRNVVGFMLKVNQSKATHIFVGGSTVNGNATDVLVKEIKKHTKLPIIIFPGDVNQITDEADALLFLSLISGRNPEYLIGKHVDSIPKLRETQLEVISTGYILINGGKQTAVERETNTKPLSVNNIQEVVDTAKAGELLGMKLIYLEAGSGAVNSASNDIIKALKKELNIPLIVGGGIRTVQQIKNTYENGADMVVIGTVLEEDELFFDELRK
ncbi:geranylgeranylglyceryl/heptaprenylglyceryl phosphate synthase [Seonamhaeicola aphaedonensis]|uniref:Geranylgeranylglyceryl phosphate synthase n=1 Tax=Seonamhaeicola aphaedonensis TaxID=1461338 RepID=A0A3D9HNZ7_9FLAO|nr:geranylgeranylglyceryl/heptaprenylglyceryl phosphate synthase [Seonamhaeicola aphaedonensis]RED50626.1 putative glycerol-1-phosphate prenyltransferase [Seonamhaeicola aphaedonensis]